MRRWLHGSARVGTALGLFATHARLGNLFLRAGKLPQAEAQYRAAIGGRTGEDSAWLNLAEILRKRGARDEASQTLRAGLDAVKDLSGRGRLSEALSQGGGD